MTKKACSYNKWSGRSRFSCTLFWSIHTNSRVRKFGSRKVVIYEIAKGTWVSKTEPDWRPKWSGRWIFWVAGKFKGKQDTEVIGAKELHELLTSGDHDSIVSSDGLMMSNKDLEALLDRSDLQCKGAASKKAKQLSKQNSKNCEFFRVVEDAPDPSWLVCLFRHCLIFLSQFCDVNVSFWVSFSYSMCFHLRTKNQSELSALKEKWNCDYVYLF